jgi:hypothetical protein
MSPTEMKPFQWREIKTESPSGHKITSFVGWHDLQAAIATGSSRAFDRRRRAIAEAKRLHGSSLRPDRSLRSVTSQAWWQA